MAISDLCSKCKINLREGVSYCGPCSREIGRENYRNNKVRYFENAQKRNNELDKLIFSYKNVPCTDCGIKYPHYVMDFDHLGEKEYGICYMRRHKMAFHKIIKEIEKCEVVCSNCHRERTNTRQPSRYRPEGNF